MTSSTKSIKNQLKTIGRFPKFLALLGASSLVIPIFSYAASAATVQPSARLPQGAQVLNGARNGSAVNYLNVPLTNLTSKIDRDGALRTSTHYSAELRINHRRTTITTTTLARVTTTTVVPTTVAPAPTSTVAPAPTVVPTTVAPAPTSTVAPAPTSTTVAPTTTTTTTPTLPSTPISTLPTSGTSFSQGIYVGPAAPSGVASFASTTGTNVTIASEYLPSSSGWAGMDGAGGSLSWLTGPWQSSGYKLSLGVPMIPTNANNVPVGTLAEGATGAYDQYFVTLAQTLVAAGEGNSYLRLGWEFDGNWYAWEAATPSAEASYATYFQQIVTAMRTVSGESFQFVWNPDAQAFTTAGYSVTAAYPGNAYVNVIGLDIYDTNWGARETSQALWTNTFLPQLSAAESFAQSQGKPIALDEWAVTTANHGLGDDPYFINNMINWMKSPSHDVVYESYFNGDSLSPGVNPDANLLGGNFPKSLSAFAADLG
jgi:hypothetical protein